MARKKSVKQKQKQSQKVVQTVNVIVGQRRKRTAGTSSYRRKQEPQIETISAKTLAPVFIQPPVTSQLPQYPITLPTEMYTVPQPTSMKIGTNIKNAVVEQVSVDDIRPMAEPLRKSKKEMLDDTVFVEPIAKSKENNIPEGYGVFYNQPLKDTDLQAERKPTFSLSAVDYIPPSYVEDANRDIAAYSMTKEKQAIREPSRELINDVKLYARDEKIRNLPDSAISDYIKKIMESEGITAKKFRKDYTYEKERQRKKYHLGKYKQEQYDVLMSRPQAVAEPITETIETKPITMISEGNIVVGEKRTITRTKPVQPASNMNIKEFFTGGAIDSSSFV